jgi:hypothetical protein
MYSSDTYIFLENAKTLAMHSRHTLCAVYNFQLLISMASCTLVWLRVFRELQFYIF